MPRGGFWRAVRWFATRQSCGTCGYTWNSRGSSASHKCPRCGAKLWGPNATKAAPGCACTTLLGWVLILFAFVFVFVLALVFGSRERTHPTPSPPLVPPPRAEHRETTTRPVVAPEVGAPSPSAPEEAGTPAGDGGRVEGAPKSPGEQAVDEETQKREAAALKLLNEAKSWEANKRYETAKAKYEELIEVFPGTKAASEGEERLRALSGR